VCEPSVSAQAADDLVDAVLGPTLRVAERMNISAGFTDPEYARAGLIEAEAREMHDVLTALVRFDSTMRTIIDGRKTGFCKLIVDRKTALILGCHVVGERAVEIAQVAARVDDLARVPLAFPTYTGNLAYAAASAARQLDLQVAWQATKLEGNDSEILRDTTKPPSLLSDPWMRHPELVR
jgi:dihydrolipoamide dehydrogenase